MEIFFSTLNQTAFLFALIAIGYVLAKGKFIPDNSASVLSKLENNVFVPALVLGTFMNNFTVETFSTAKWILLISTVIMLIVLPFAILFPKVVTKDKYLQNIYTYGLSFSNFGFMGNAVVSVLFPEMFMDYLIFTLPLWVLIYLWGVPELLIANAGEKKSFKTRLKAFLNPMFVGMIIGMIIGMLQIPLPVWLKSVVKTSGDCMSPIAMLLTGITVSTISFKKTFSDVRTYIVAIVRLIVFPLVFIAVAKLVPMGETVFVCALCSLAMPLGLNTIVIPSAYGKDTTVAAGMAVISHLLSCLTIPLIFMLI